MTTTNEEVTGLVRAMRKNLLSQHGIDVPYSALRASYLAANGENPHAFKAKAVAAKRVKSGADNQEWFDLPMYLAADDVGCLERLSLDAEGQSMLPEDWSFEAARLLTQDATIPRVSKYGLPDYLGNARHFYDSFFGLPFAEDYSHKYFDTNDDSGDTCALVVQVTRDELARIVKTMLKGEAPFIGDVAEWVGVNYKHNFEAFSSADQVNWAMRYLVPDCWA